MGGFAVVIDWDRPVDPREVDPMMALVPHRTTGGVRVHATTHAVLAEGRTTSQTRGESWQIATLGPLTIVGDIRLLRREDLRVKAGVSSASTGLCDRQLILAAYRRVGPDFLDAIDGDYAFVIWDDEARSVLAVRDRFAIRAIFFERTKRGVRFASEVKQLAATSTEPIRLNDRAVGEYLLNTFEEARFSFFDGIERVRASDAITFTPDGERRLRYWTPVRDIDRSLTAETMPFEFRDRLVDSVRRRLAWAPRSVAHLSGGLDSTTVVASAQHLHGIDATSVDLHTVSAIFPGFANDETPWIDDLVASQPFAHHRFVPRIATIEQFDGDMWVRDHPWVDRDRDLWFHTTEIAHEVGATQVLTGNGGDHVLDQDRILADRLRALRLGAFRSGLDAAHGWTGQSRRTLAVEAARLATPPRIRNAIRTVIRHRPDHLRGLLSADFARSFAKATPESEPRSSGLASLSADALSYYGRTAMAAWIMESHESEHAAESVEETNPYFDRSLYDFVASIPIEVFPFDGRSKALARSGFADLLPPSVLDRRTKTSTMEYTRNLFRHHCSEYVSRYPRVTEAGLHYLDPGFYASTMTRLQGGHATVNDERSAWFAWTLMAFLDIVPRYARTAGWSDKDPTQR